MTQEEQKELVQGNIFANFFKLFLMKLKKDGTILCEHDQESLATEFCHDCKISLYVIFIYYVYEISMFFPF